MNTTYPDLRDLFRLLENFLGSPVSKSDIKQNLLELHSSKRIPEGSLETCQSLPSPKTAQLCGFPQSQVLLLILILKFSGKALKCIEIFVITGVIFIF